MKEREQASNQIRINIHDASIVVLGPLGLL